MIKTLLTGTLAVFLLTGNALSAVIPLNSPEGKIIFAGAEDKADFFTLINHFESQQNGVFCGAASAATVLNMLRVPFSTQAEHAPQSLGLTQQQQSYIPADVNPALVRYTQTNIFDVPTAKKLPDVLGRGTRDFGFQLRQLAQLFTAHGLHTDVRIVVAPVDIDEIIADISANLARSGDAILVNYRRSEMGQQGGGHISPLGAYDKTSRRFLILDVNPTRAPFVWVEADTLIAAMQTFDTEENRGYLHVSASKD